MRLLCLLFTWLLLACQHHPHPEPAPAAPAVPAPAAPLAGGTFLSLGDSYTIGEGVGEADRWSVQLAELLRQHGAAMQPPDLIARTGWTTAELQQAIAASGNQKTYALVSLLIGVNDQYQGGTPEAYRPRLRALLQTATQFAGGRAGRVLVLSIPDWGQSPYAQGQNRTQIGAEIDQFNQVARQECQRAGIAFVDITPLTRAAAGDATQFAPDRLHYSGAQMRRWAALALPVAENLLAK